MRSLFPIALLALTVVGCAAPRPAADLRPVAVAAPPPRPVPVAQPQASDWNDWPFTPGEWTYRREASGSAAVFGASTILLRCDRSRRAVMLSAAGAGPATVRATAITRAVAPDATGALSLAATDPLLDAIAFSRGRFVIERAGQPPLVLPPQAEIGRVIEDCRG